MDFLKISRGALKCLAFVWSFSFAATQSVSVDKQSNYNSWGTAWDSVYVMKNGIVTLAAVPKIGGRIMQYDLGTHASIYVDDANKGKVPAVSALLGGFRTLASPQSNFTWPPSPMLEVGSYSCVIKINTPDSGVIYLQSPIENTTGYPTLNGLQFKRTISLYPTSSHVKVVMTMVNAGSQTLPAHGIWDITERICQNNNTLDTANIWVYFPLNPASVLNKGKGYIQLQGTDTSQWKRTIAPGGIMGVQYRRKEAKIGADSKAGWTCYVDRLDGYAYVKRFTYEEGKTYPDTGSSVELYTSGTTAFLEEEVMGPMATLAPKDSLRMTEDWYAARSKGPILAVNDAGLITKKITVQQSQDSVKAQGVYGVFYQGVVKSLFKNSAGATVAIADSITVSPLDSFTYTVAYKVPGNAVKLFLALYGKSGAFIGNLDSASLQPSNLSQEGKFLTEALSQNPSIYVKGNVLYIHPLFGGRSSVELIDLRGKSVAVFTGKMSDQGISLTTFSPGVYWAIIKSLDWTNVIKVFERRIIFYH